MWPLAAYQQPAAIDGEGGGGGEDGDSIDVLVAVFHTRSRPWQAGRGGRADVAEEPRNSYCVPRYYIQFSSFFFASVFGALFVPPLSVIF